MYISCLKSLIAAVFVIYIYPRVLFSKFCKDKKFLYKLFFCSCSSIMFLTFLGIAVFFVFDSHQQIYFSIVYFGVLAFSVIWKLIRYFYIDRKKINTQLIKQLKIHLMKILKLKYLVILIVLIMFLYTSVDYVFVNNYYNFSDMYTHITWVRYMFRDHLFASGIYPFGMHFVIYAMNLVPFCSLGDSYLYLAIIQDILIFFAVYWFCKTLFKSSSTSICVMLLFSVLYISKIITNPNSRVTFNAINRLITCLPMEFGLFCVFVCGVCVLKFLDNKTLTKNKFNKNVFTNKYLILFVLAVATSLNTHPYNTFYIVITCACIFALVIWGKKIFNLLLFVLAGVAGVVGSVLPYAIYFIKLPKLEESFNWAVKIIRGWYKLDLGDLTYDNTVSTTSGVTSSAASCASGGSVESSANNGFFDWLGSVYNDSIVPFVGKENTPGFWCVFIVCVLLLIGLVVWLKRTKGKNVLVFNNQQFALYFEVKSHNKNVEMSRYFIPLLLLFVLYLLYAAPALGIPRLIESFRVVLIMYFLICMCFVAPFAVFAKQFRIKKHN